LFGRTTRQPAVADGHGFALESTALQCTASGVVRRFYQAFNDRNVDAMADCISDDIEHNNLAYAKVFRGKAAAVAFYAAFIEMMPDDASFFIEDTTGASPMTEGGSKIGVLWYESAAHLLNFTDYHSCKPLMVDPYLKL
jgi:hypothetical protein